VRALLLLHTGRYYLEVEGRRRLHLVSSSDLDGYRMARARPFADDPEPEDGPDAPTQGSSQQVRPENLRACLSGPLCMLLLHPLHPYAAFTVTSTRCSTDP